MSLEINITLENIKEIIIIKLYVIIVCNFVHHCTILHKYMQLI